MARLRVNGREVTVAEDHPHLLSALREELDVLSPKDGCSPSGQCGCCTVLIGGKARIACQTDVAKLDLDGAFVRAAAAGDGGRDVDVVTIEGLDPLEVDRMASAFAACGALQCGFCTPGIVVRTKSLIDKKGAALTREEASRHLGAHLCRCTGYVKVLDAVEALARDEVPEPVAPGGIGSRGIKYEGCELAVGRRPFIDDLRPDGLLHGALHLSAHARADVMRIDTAAAEAVDGVVAVFTGADVPAENRVGIIHKDWPVFIPEGGRTSYLGDVLAVVVAVDRRTARRAAALIEVDYRPLRPITNPVLAIDDPDDAVWELPGNVLSRSAYRRGDVDAALERSTHVAYEVFQTPRIEHAFLEPESTLAMPTDDGGLYVYSGGQGVWDDRNDIARMLGVDPSIVTVELVSNGGAFGGKEDMSNQAHTALAAWLLKRPVKISLSREESLLMHPKRHPIRMEYWAGCDAEGNLTAVKARMVGDSGPYASVGMKVLERAAGHASGPYTVPAIDVEAVAVRTNNPVCGAFRGFGANQAQFAMEGMIDRLAEKVGLSGWDMRWRNVVDPGAVWGPGQIMDEGCLGAHACLEAVRPHIEAARAAGKPVGLGLGLKNSGLGNGFKEIAKAVVRFLPAGSTGGTAAGGAGVPAEAEEAGVGAPAGPTNIVEVRHCWTEMGQGIHTVALQVAVEELGVPADRIRVVVDTTRELGAGQTTGSRGTLMGAGSVADACRKAVADGCQVGVDYEGEFRVDWTNSLNEGVANPIIHSAFGYAAQVVIIDPATGEIEKVVAAHDVGRAVNPTLCEGQIEGAVHMGLGYALSEGFPADEAGRPLNSTLRSLDIIRPKDMPPVEVILVEAPQPRAPYGIKGVGEIGLVPTAGAVAAALRAHDGIWHNELPIRTIANRERASAWES